MVQVNEWWGVGYLRVRIVSLELSNEDLPPLAENNGMAMIVFGLNLSHSLKRGARAGRAPLKTTSSMQLCAGRSRSTPAHAGAREVIRNENQPNGRADLHRVLTVGK
jgi:hypothetical protein